jgi:hypothetical protein
LDFRKLKFWFLKIHQQRSLKIHRMGKYLDIIHNHITVVYITYYDTVDNGFISRIFKEFIQLNKTTTKYGQQIWTDISSKTVYKWPLSIWKDTQYL